MKVEALKFKVMMYKHPMGYPFFGYRNDEELVYSYRKPQAYACFFLCKYRYLI
jgi:hypothetical protein